MGKGKLHQLIKLTLLHITRESVLLYIIVQCAHIGHDVVTEIIRFPPLCCLLWIYTTQMKSKAHEIRACCYQHKHLLSSHTQLSVQR